MKDQLCTNNKENQKTNNWLRGNGNSSVKRRNNKVRELRREN